MISETLCKKIIRLHNEISKRTAPRKYTHADFKGLDFNAAEYLCLIMNNGAMMAKTIIEQNMRIRKMKTLRLKTRIFKWRE